MVITFLIGNGFDLNLGMKTSFIDVYKEYTAIPSFSPPVIRKFKETLRNDASMHYSTWADFEMGMAEYAETFENEDDFILCIRDFKSFLAKHLDQQESAYVTKINNFDYGLLVDEFFKSVSNFYDEESKNLINKIKSFGQVNEINFINFNYTHTLDAIIKRMNINYRFLSLPIHIHGELGNDVVLGVNNVEQIKNNKFRTSKKVKRAFVKPDFNCEYDEARVNSALFSIESSNIVCAFGMSFGDSDKMWIDEIIQFLKSDNKNQFFLFIHGLGQYDRMHRDLIMDVEDEKKVEFLKRIGFDENNLDSIIDQIHIPITKKIFEFNDIPVNDVKELA